MVSHWSISTTNSFSTMALAGTTPVAWWFFQTVSRRRRPFRLKTRWMAPCATAKTCWFGGLSGVNSKGAALETLAFASGRDHCVERHAGLDGTAAVLHVTMTEAIFRGAAGPGR